MNPLLVASRLALLVQTLAGDYVTRSFRSLRGSQLLVDNSGSKKTNIQPSNHSIELPVLALSHLTNLNNPNPTR